MSAPAATPSPAAFLDRDGVIIDDVGYLDDPAGVKLCPGAADGLSALAAAGYRLVVVTNQSGVARGYFDEQRLGAIHTELCTQLGALGVTFCGLYHCPHHPEGAVPALSVVCECRKPEPGLLVRACAELDLDPARSVMVGDSPRDIEAGYRAGCARGYWVADAGAEYPDGWRPPTAIVPSLAAAAALITRAT